MALDVIITPASEMGKDTYHFGGKAQEVLFIIAFFTNVGALCDQG